MSQVSSQRSPRPQCCFFKCPSDQQFHITTYNYLQKVPKVILKATSAIAHLEFPVILTARLCNSGVTFDVALIAGGGLADGVTVSITTVTAVLVDWTPLLVKTS